MAATIATYAGRLGFSVDNFEPTAWVEELIEPARAVDHPRLATLYGIASLCFMAGRIEDAVRYSDGGQIVLDRSPNAPPYGVEGWLGGVYLAIGQPERWAEFCYARLSRRHETHVHIRTCLVYALAFAGPSEEAMVAANGLIEAAEATRNPYMLSFALSAYGYAFRDTDPIRALGAVRRGLVIARDSGNRDAESSLAINLAHLEATHGDPLAAFEYFTVGIRNYHDAGNIHSMRAALAPLAACLDRQGCYESAATIAGFAFSPLSPLVFPVVTTTIAHLRDVLGDPTYELFARKGETMNAAAMATYACDQIDEARTKLEAVSK